MLMNIFRTLSRTYAIYFYSVPTSHLANAKTRRSLNENRIYSQHKSRDASKRQVKDGLINLETVWYLAQSV